MVVYFIKGVFLFLTRQTIIVNSRLMEFDLKERIYGHYSKLDAEFYKSNDTGDLMNRISEDVSKVRMFLERSDVLYQPFVLIIIVVSVMVSIDLKLTLFALLPLPLMSVGIYFISSKINRLRTPLHNKASVLCSAAHQRNSFYNRTTESLKLHRDLKKKAINTKRKHSTLLRLNLCSFRSSFYL